MTKSAYDPFTQAEIDTRLKFIPAAKEICKEYFYVNFKYMRGVQGKRRGPAYGLTYEEAVEQQPDFIDGLAEEILNVMLALHKAGYDILKQGSYMLRSSAGPKLKVVKVHRPGPRPPERIPVSHSQPQHPVKRRVLNKGRRVLNEPTSVGSAVSGTSSGLSVEDFREGGPGSSPGGDEGERLESGAELSGGVPPEDAGQLSVLPDPGGDSDDGLSGEMD